jgi:3-methylcrotonyl-CoA carboxylase alpha subunit
MIAWGSFWWATIPEGRVTPEIGFPLLIKASAGGGGKGMRVVRGEDAFAAELETAKREASAAFGDDTVLLEKYLVRPRHIEFQVFGDAHRNLMHLFERECSIQRRHQKIVEETPSTALDEELRGAMAAAALNAARTVNYDNAGTVEFMLDEDGSFYFLEMNTRLQVEHPVTEMITGVDLVRMQILAARGEALPLTQEQITRRGHAIEVRVYAEDPANNFFPQTGKLLRYQEPDGLGIRVDSGIREGDTISVFYDPMVAKLIAYGQDREAAREKLRSALAHYPVHGVRTNIAFLHRILGQEAFIAGETTTDYLEKFPPEPPDPAAVRDTVIALTALAPTGASNTGAKGVDTTASVRDPWMALGPWRAGGRS